MPALRFIADALAATLLHGPADRDSLLQRAERLLERRGPWLARLLDRLQTAHPIDKRPRRRIVARFLRHDTGLQRAHLRYELSALFTGADPPSMQPAPVAADWEILPLHSTGDVAAWLGVALGELNWFADRRHWEARSRPPKLQHYRYRILAKRFDQFRLIEAPKPRLKAIQRRILADILSAVPPHEAAHGFRQAHSVKTFAAAHVNQKAVVKLDLQDFFPSIRLSCVQAIFRSLGYPEVVADILAGLCTNTAPQHQLRSNLPVIHAGWQRQARVYFQPHLPQGAPTSPALANLASWRMDVRLSALASACGARYTRYADDLAFSGDEKFARGAERFLIHAAAIAMLEGFVVNHRKSRIMRSGVRQRVGGVVVNQRLNITRRDFDQLKAILTNCVRHGPASQNREEHADFRAHLCGRISWLEHLNPVRGKKLRRLFEQIEW
ncbi:MAG: reverse transcriptase family protein [Planctomycetaceae bacterium]|nr:reverse transcriptase family protein [Planctomycetaceae bacterium]